MTTTTIDFKKAAMRIVSDSDPFKTYTQLVAEGLEKMYEKGVEDGLSRAEVKPSTNLSSWEGVF